jgi:hypothetical protein
VIKADGKAIALPKPPKPKPPPPVAAVPPATTP